MPDATPIVCSVDDCESPVDCRGWCTKHYQRWRCWGDPLVTLTPNRGQISASPGDQVCSVDGCGRTHYARTWCRLHYKRWYATGSVERYKPTDEERFWAKVDKAGPVPDYAPHLGPC